MEVSMSQHISRKEFLRDGAKLVVGASVGVAGLSLASAKETSQNWPWPYQSLDPDHVRILGHDSFWQEGKGCCYGAFNGIIQALAEKVGEPYTSFPTELMIYGHGGAVGWGTLCGALNGAAAAICLVVDKATSDKLINELIGWYTQTEFPTEASNDFAVNHRYTDQRYDQPLAKSVCGSPLCHVSVTEWCIAAGFKAGSTERKERCARLTGDVVAYAVELLNKEIAGQFTPIYVPPASIAGCMACHGSAFISNVNAKMECMQCHGDPHASTAVKQMEESAGSFQLHQNYPNPFNPATSIQFALPQPEKVHLAIYDLRGRLVRTLVDHELHSQGWYTLSWDGRDNVGQKAASGIYFTKFQAGKFAATKKMTLVE
jgi:hypothetical protein